jgi:cytochrome c553
VNPVIVTGLMSLVGVILTGVFGLLLARMLRPNELIDQLQEERKETRVRLTGLEVRELIRDDYIHALRQHITDGKPPPPPTWPEALIRTGVHA